MFFFFFVFQAEDGIRDYKVTGVQTCALPILSNDAGTWQDDGVREAAPADIPALHEIAGQGHTDSGFYRTAAFPPSCAMRCIAPGSRRVAQLCGRRFGGRTGLTADWVHLLPSEWRRQRPDSPHGGGQRDQEPGRCQTTRALCALLVSGAGGSECHGGDPGSNVTAHRLYQRSGFLTSGSQLWYH